ncbi:MAG: 3-hydroxylacyl-ACP dehydratase [Proteobacteria bacterium]|nr:3-hydroxylacyl-ACP dehydratase [Pseudomonadota bacterium]
MLDRAAIQGLIPHQGAMCLLETVLAWTQDDIACRGRSHLAPDNPLRRGGRLSAMAGIEYGLQAAALHGALRSQAPLPPGWLAALRGVTLHVTHLDDPTLGQLQVAAQLIHGDAGAMIYDFALRAEDTRLLVDGRATIALQRPAA